MLDLGRRLGFCRLGDVLLVQRPVPSLDRCEQPGRGRLRHRRSPRRLGGAAAVLLGHLRGASQPAATTPSRPLDSPLAELPAGSGAFVSLPTAPQG